jgi:hypothetical protein
MMRFWKRREKKYSFLEEQEIISWYTNTLENKSGYVCDIGASDGITMSNTYQLFKNGYPGLAVECDDHKFMTLAKNYEKLNVCLSNVKVTPYNIIDLFKAYNVPHTPLLLSLDIDGYDYYVLDSLLSHYRPCVVCVEINEKIPPPIKFTVKYDDGYMYKCDHFYGQSICQLYETCKKHSYSLVELHYNNAFLVPAELPNFKPLTPVQAYDEGYKFKDDRAEKFPWNSDMDSLLSMSVPDSLKFIGEKFGERKSEYSLSVMEG